MELDVLRLTADYYHKLLDAELHINEWVQDRQVNKNSQANLIYNNKYKSLADCS